MRILTWNIHKGIGGLDRRYRPERIIEILAHHDPDVAFLQEVDEDAPRSRGDRQVDLYADALGYPHRAFGPNVVLKRGRYGNATLSRYPIVRSENVNLTYAVKKPRGALVTDLQVPVQGHRLMVHAVNLHLGLAGVERRWQVARLLDSSALSHLDGLSRILVAGDLNDWTGRIARWFQREQGFYSATGKGNRRTRTFPAWRPVTSLDGVFVRGAFAVGRHFPSRLSLAKDASDHLPVIVEVDPIRR